MLGGINAMNKNMKQICREIEQGNNLEMNLPQFFNRLVTLYEQYAEIKFTMLYYTFYENYLESDQVKTMEEEQLLLELNHIIQESVLSDFSGGKMENSVQRLDAARNEIINKMKILTAYTDILQIYEYVLNRIEYRFRDDLKEINNDEFAAEILRYIFDTKDNVIINSKIKEVIGQLPIRITKSKYFDLIRDSISIYNGADCSSLDSYIYMIKNGAMLYTQDGMDTAYPDLLALKKEFETIDYNNFTKENYHTFSNKLGVATSQINARVDFYYGLQEIVNNLYVMIITAPYAYMEGGYRLAGIEGEMKYLLYPTEQEKNLFKAIIAEINERFLTEEKMPISADIEAKLSYTEGKQEVLLEEFEALEPVLSDIRTSHNNMVESMMLGRLFQCLNTSQDLLGNSLFIELNKTEDYEVCQDEQLVINNNKVNEAYIIKVQDELLNQFSELFQNSSKNVCRAVMANTINKMPVFFQSTKDVMDYVKNSLEQCHDLAEKNACVNIIKTFWVK
jgi:hypothetical protein